MGRGLARKMHVITGQNMIASFSRNFIFIKTRKTAGTSVEVLLSPGCGPDDIITPVSPSDERLRMVEGAIAARNFMGDADEEARYRKAVLCNDRQSCKAISSCLKRRGHFYNHMPANEIKKKLPKLWDSAFKFTVERHPYEKAMSMAFHQAKRKRSQDIAQFVDQVIERRMYDDTPLYLIKGKLAVDRVIRQERFSEELKELADQLGIRLPETLPHAKGKARFDRRPAKEILTPDQKRKIQSSLAFELFGYEP
jgi:hypothetical protein